MGALASFPLYGVFADAINNHPYLLPAVAFVVFELALGSAVGTLIARNR